jgi:cell division protein FtsW (lipid II flippase)
MLAAYGIPVPRLARVQSASELEAAAVQVGFPCVLKVDSTEVVHKSEAGGVVLGIEGPEALARRFQEMRERFTGPGVSYLLVEQKPAGRELILGASAAPGLGTLVMFGLALALLLMQRDLGAAMIFFLLYAAVVYLASGERGVLILAGLGLMLSVLIGYRLFDVVQTRVDSWLNPWVDPSGRSYQIIQALIAIANGGMIGRGPG